MSYSTVSGHRDMVFDRERNALYARAIRRLVTPDSAVLDLGAGLGIHGLLAAAAGARKVYLVEPEPVVQVAMELARANGLADRIVVLQGRIEDVELPEPVDLIVSVFTGNLLFSEDLLPSLLHARDRWLKPGGHLLPDRAELWLAPVTAAALHARHVGVWATDNHGLQFTAARRFAANAMINESRDALEVGKLAAGAVIAAVDLYTATHADCFGQAHTTAVAGGVCDGLLGWIRIALDGEWLSTDVDSPSVHWSPVVLPIDPPLPLVASEAVTMKLQRPAHGDWSWTVHAAAGERRHSSFLGRCDGPSRLQLMAPTAAGPLSERGCALQQVLAQMQALRINVDIAASLAAEFPRLFADTTAALLFVQQTALQYRSAAGRESS